MITTTMSSVNLMVAIAATILLLTGTNTVKIAQSARFLISLVLKPGKAMDFVMMSTTKPNVSLILVIVATITTLTMTFTVTIVLNVRS
jgi:hypothetical protein